MLNVNLSYKPPSYWRIPFWSGGLPRKFSCLKRFRALVIPGWVFRKGTTLQSRQLKNRFSCGRPFIIEKKRGCNWSVCTCTQSEEYYVCTNGQKVYLWDQTTRKPSLANPLVLKTLPGTRFISLLQCTPIWKRWPYLGAWQSCCTDEKGTEIAVWAD